MHYHPFREVIRLEHLPEPDGTIRRHQACGKRARHAEHEALYWVKAAATLGFPKIDMLNSEVPISASRAKADLFDLFVDNLERP